VDAENRPVPPETKLFRRVAPKLEDGYVLDEDDDCLRLSSAAFLGKEMSVFLGDTLEEEGRDPLDALRQEPGFFLVSLTAADAIEAEQAVVRSPIDEEPAHGDVVGKKTRGRRRALARAAIWIKAPDGLCPDEKVA
jgi:hypothetical protein